MSGLCCVACLVEMLSLPLLGLLTLLLSCLSLRFCCVLHANHAHHSLSDMLLCLYIIEFSQVMNYMTFRADYIASEYKCIMLYSFYNSL